MPGKNSGPPPAGQPARGERGEMNKKAEVATKVAGSDVGGILAKVRIN